MSERTFLEEITIRSIGVIDQSTLEISKGLTVLTGETGAGKTMILTALNLILGGKADSALVRKGSERLVASGRFSIPRSSEYLFEDVLVEDGELIVTRTVSSDGKSKATTNGVSATASTLSSVGENLVEVHGQAANQNITKSFRQRELLDRFGQIDLGAYQEALQEYHELKERISALKKSIAQKDKELFELREFVTAFKKLNPTVSEFAEIDGEISRLSSVEEFRLATAQASSAIEDEEVGALTSLGIARRALEAARSKDPLLESIYQQLSESFFLLDDAQSALNSYQSKLEADPARLDFLHARKADITTLIKKFGGLGTHEQELIELAVRYKNSSDAIADLEGGDQRLQELEKQLLAHKKILLSAAKTLSENRIKAADQLSRLVTAEIQQLSMPHATFVTKVDTADYAAPKESDFTAQGCDEIAMFIQGHKDAPLVSLAKGASGGEMSRVMLALEVVIATTHPIGTYVFDEVDAGVGGKAAIEVGKRLHQLAQHAQVIVVTHLPQVAAWADSHFVVTKNNDGTVSQSDVKNVSGEDRIEEIARMLAGLENSSSAREHATELLSLKV
ncbi:MAG: DNA repair protein RecN [Actinobacteria bacterium]|uniref:DNA repair protein RecN n=1 Tax=freshwater metagenome TaxID=449393 RepID=A0A6J6AV81_9ZZZZ|nr:DNA repair protein RecN [Actinomycetota bacterium]